MADGKKESGPVGLYEVVKVPCYVLNVKIVRGHVTDGRWSDMMDTPDTYVKLNVRRAPSPRRQTKSCDNENEPIWNETFRFFLKYVDGNNMELTLMDSDYISDDTLSTQTIKIPNLNDLMERSQEMTINFNESLKIDIEMWAESDNSDLAIYCEQELCKEEKTFLEKRKERAYRVMQELLGKDAPKTPNEVPTIAVMGSGGGFRAITAYSGAMGALVDSKIADMVMYNLGLSGSAWYLSTLYSNPEFPRKSPRELRKELGESIESSPRWIVFNHRNWIKCISDVRSAKASGQPFSFTDVYGHMVGETLLKGRINSKLTDQREMLKEGLVPLPLYAGVHVKPTTSAKVFHEWVEFSPYLIGMSKYGTFMRTELFGSKFFEGRLITKYDESPLHFFQGLWGSAYCILLNRFVGVSPEKTENEDEEREELDKEVDEELATLAENDDESSDDEDCGNAIDEKKVEKNKKKQKSIFKRFYDLLGIDSLVNNIQGRAAVVFNYMHGLVLQKYHPTKTLQPLMVTETRKFLLEISTTETKPLKLTATQGFLQKISISTTETTEGQFDEIFEMYPTEHRKMYLVDAGLAFNSPYPLILRPERQVDLILSFEFSSRKYDKANPLSELVLAAEWAKLNKFPFPEIDPTVIDREGFKECYLFENPEDPNCPIVMHFILYNNQFRKFKSPGVPRVTPEDFEYGNFDVFDDSDKPYATSKFQYSNKAFNRLADLMEFNTLFCKDLIIENIRKCVKRKSQI